MDILWFFIFKYNFNVISSTNVFIYNVFFFILNGRTEWTLDTLLTADQRKPNHHDNGNDGIINDHDLVWEIETSRTMLEWKMKCRSIAIWLVITGCEFCFNDYVVGW